MTEYNRIKEHRLATFDGIIRRHFGLLARTWGPTGGAADVHRSDEVISEPDREFAHRLVRAAWGEMCSDSIDDLEEPIALLSACVAEMVSVVKGPHVCDPQLVRERAIEDVSAAEVEALSDEVETAWAGGRDC
jgi:hypothetical protein